MGIKGFTLAKCPAQMMQKRAFTLAEVLVTLGIIGVIAAMTMPALTGKYRANVTMTKLQKFLSTMQQAQLRSIIDNGEVDSWDWVPAGGESNNEIVLAWFNKYWAPYLNSIRIIDRKVLKNNEAVDGGITFILGDGSVANMSGFNGGYLHVRFYPNYKSFMNESTIEGVDEFVFGFNITTSKRFNTYGSEQKDYEELKYNSDYGCYAKNTRYGNAYCARLLQSNGWKVPDDYPYKF